MHRRSFEVIEKKLFKKAMSVSFVTHILVIALLSIPHTNSLKFPKPVQSFEITYKSVKAVNQPKKKVAIKDLKVIKKPQRQERQKVKVLTKKSNMFSVIGDRLKDISKMSGQLLASREKNTDLTMLDVGRKITLTPLTTAKITNPKYLIYNNDMESAISRNIKQKAYTYVNHADFQAGKVYLTFVLASSGMLKQVQIIESKTFANDYLRSVALRSIKESSPFPPFPIGFNYPEFTFNLLISFQD